MDRGLIGWARAVKRRRRNGLPVLWLFTDADRVPDPLPSIAALPKLICGVVFRHDGVPGRAELGRRVAQLCRARRLSLVVAGDARLAIRLRAGLHMRAGRRPGLVRPGHGMMTSSAHSVPDIRRAWRAGASIVFISPVFATGSHPGQAPLGPARFATLRRTARGMNAYALGGIDGQKIKALATFCCGAGAIHALKAGNSQ